MFPTGVFGACIHKVAKTVKSNQESIALVLLIKRLMLNKYVSHVLKPGCPSV